MFFKSASPLPGNALCNGQEEKTGDQLSVIFTQTPNEKFPYTAYVSKSNGKYIDFSPRTLPCQTVLNDKVFSCIQCVGDYLNIGSSRCDIFTAKSDGSLEYVFINTGGLKGYEFFHYPCHWL